MVATTLGTGKYTCADVFGMVMDNHPDIEDALHGKEQLLGVQYAITNALKEAEAVGKIRMCGKSKMEGLVFEPVLRGRPPKKSTGKSAPS